MLASITPLGERSRNSKWSVTVSAFVAGSLGAGLAIGAAAGAVGAPLAGSTPDAVRLGLLAGLIALGLTLDLRSFGRALPGLRRQVNEQWLHRYRGWVYGLGFGVQLGTGVATIVSTSAVYSMLAAVILTGSAAWGALVGAAFGLLRGLSVVPARRVRAPGDLVRLDALLGRWDRPARAVSTGLLLTFVILTAAAAIL
jgi:sulfite exporter TauE/SafE